MSRFVTVSALALVTAAAVGCVRAQPATDTGDTLNPAAPDAAASSSTTTTGGTGAANGAALAYDPDLKAVFTSDCVACHGGFRVDAGYSMANYAQVMRAVQPGNASSVLVVVTQSRGSMYPFFSGNRAAKSQMVYDWVVTNHAAQTR